jgi:hypothetical protein
MSQEDIELLLAQAGLLIQRLERLSVDSCWAHRSSGYRGSMLRVMDQLEEARDGVYPEIEITQLNFLIRKGFEILEAAARELGEGQ